MTSCPPQKRTLKSGHGHDANFVVTDGTGCCRYNGNWPAVPPTSDGPVGTIATLFFSVWALFSLCHLHFAFNDDNLRCHQWQQSWHHNNSGFSVSNIFIMPSSPRPLLIRHCANNQAAAAIVHAWVDMLGALTSCFTLHLPKLMRNYQQCAPVRL